MGVTRFEPPASLESTEEWGRGMSNGWEDGSANLRIRRGEGVWSVGALAHQTGARISVFAGAKGITFYPKFFYSKLFCPKLFCPKLFCPKLF